MAECPSPAECAHTRDVLNNVVKEVERLPYDARVRVMFAASILLGLSKPVEKTP